jgi:hypothetical protein
VDGWPSHLEPWRTEKELFTLPHTPPPRWTLTALDLRGLPDPLNLSHFSVANSKLHFGLWEGIISLYDPSKDHFLARHHGAHL